MPNVVEIRPHGSVRLADLQWKPRNAECEWATTYGNGHTIHVYRPTPEAHRTWWSLYVIPHDKGHDGAIRHDDLGPLEVQALLFHYLQGNQP